MSPHVDLGPDAADVDAAFGDQPPADAAFPSRQDGFARYFTKKRMLLFVLVCAAGIAVTGTLLRRSATPPFEGLDQGSQKYIWHAEHIAFELETHFGKPLTKALKKRDADALRRCCLASFAGSVLEFDETSTRRHGVVAEVRGRAGRGQSRRVDAGGFVDYLLDLASRFDHIESAKLRVLRNDLADAEAGRWDVRFLLTLAGAAREGGPAEVASEHRVTCVFASDEEIAARRILAQWHVQSQSFRRSERPLMEEATQQTGLATLPLADNWKLPHEIPASPRRHVAVEDFDRDGDLDVAVATIEGETFLLRSENGARFEDVAAALGIGPSPTFGAFNEAHSLCAWIDYDNDGFPDLLIGQHLYHNEGGRKFSRVIEDAGLRFETGTMGATVADYNADGWADLYINYWGTSEGHVGKKVGWVGDDGSGSENQLWRNEGGKRFRNVTEQARAGGGRRQTFATAWLYADRDAWPDLYLANDFGENVLLRNRGNGRFEDITRRTGTGDFATSMGVAAGDLDNDGTPEIYVANMFSKMGRRIIAHVDADDYPDGVFKQIKGSCAGNRLYRLSKGQTRFEEISEPAGVNAVGWAFAPAMGDLDGDGLLDLYATAGYISVDRSKPDG